MAEEAKITINGHEVTGAQAMAIRVACAVYLHEMSNNPDALGNDDHGRQMTELYKQRLGEVMRLILA